MERSGLSIQVIPLPDGSGDHGFLISHTLWVGGQCEQSRIVVNESAQLANDLSVRPDNLLWILDILEVASQLVQRKATPRRPEPVRGSNPYWPDTTGKPLQL